MEPPNCVIPPPKQRVQPPCREGSKASHSRSAGNKDGSLKGFGLSFGDHSAGPGLDGALPSSDLQKPKKNFLSGFPSFSELKEEHTMGAEASANPNLKRGRGGSLVSGGEPHPSLAGSRCRGVY